MFQDPLNVPRPAFLEREDVRMFEDSVRGFMAKECVPNAERWEEQG
ncbi:MAG: acyl-CoA dehydrogenase, partial [Maricaulis maris]